MEDKPLNCESEQAAAGAMFDAFCKEVLRNTVFNYKRKIKRQSCREVITPDPEQYIFARDAVFDVYETDHLVIEFEGSIYIRWTMKSVISRYLHCRGICWVYFCSSSGMVRKTR